MKSDWQETTIGEITESCLGKMLDKKKNKGTLQPYLANVNVRWGEFELDSLSLMKFEESEQERYGLKYGDIVLCEGGEPGRCAIWRNQLPNIKIQKALHRIRAHENVDNEYLYYWLLHAGRSGILRKYFTGSTIQHLPGDKLKSINLFIPPLNYQRRVARVLSCIDAKIEANKQINDNLEQQAAAMFRDLFITQADPSWTEGTISDLGTVVGGSTPSKAKAEYYTEHGIAWITPKDLSVDKSKFISHGADDITELGLHNSSASIMPKGTVLFSSRAPIGYIAIADGDVTTNQGFKSVVPHSNIGTAFVYFFLKDALPIIEGMASGSTFKEISGSAMRTVPAVIPDDATLQRFSAFCEPIFEQQRSLERQNRLLASFRDMLLPRLMSGEIDVSNITL